MRSTSLVTSLLLLASNTQANLFNYTTVTGFFLQDLNSINATTFDYTAVNFGLINQTYTTDASQPANRTQWQRFTHYVSSLNRNASQHTTYKVIFLGRHGEGYHNAAETYYGTPAWNCYWSLLNGNSTTTWADAALTSNGIEQALVANAYWKFEIATQKTPVPQSFYTSPLTRCLATLNLTFPAADYYPQNHTHRTPVIKELLREGISLHTCDRRSNQTTIARSYPQYRFEHNFSEHDPLWNPVYAETSAGQDARSQSVLDDIFRSDPNTYLSITSHSGEIASILRALGHRVFGLNTGAVIPVLVKAVKVQGRNATVTATGAPRATSAHCTVPPLTSVSGGACVCVNSAAPVTSPLVTNVP